MPPAHCAAAYGAAAASFCGAGTEATRCGPPPRPHLGSGLAAHPHRCHHQLYPRNPPAADAVAFAVIAATVVAAAGADLFVQRGLATAATAASGARGGARARTEGTEGFHIARWAASTRQVQHSSNVVAAAAVAAMAAACPGTCPPDGVAAELRGGCSAPP
eukprot:1161686-Pelagomonas_calceolata.AAC.9